MRFLAILALLVLPLPVQAEHKKLRRLAEILVYVAPIATSVWATHEAHNCRVRSGVAPCAGGYGPFAAREAGIRGGLSITLTGLSMWGHKERYKEWFAPAVGMAAFNTVVAIKQSKIHQPKELE